VTEPFVHKRGGWQPPEEALPWLGDGQPGARARVRIAQAPAATVGQAGPAERDARLRPPPRVSGPRVLQHLRFGGRQIEFVFGARRRLGDVFVMRTGVRGGAVVTCVPEHARSLFTADPELVPSLTAESPLRPILGPSSVLTANGARHLRQRRLLLPAFHGEAVERFGDLIGQVCEQEIETWPLQRPFALAPRMQALTLEVIMAAVFGVQGRQRDGSPEQRLRATVSYLTAASTSPLAKLGELMNFGRSEPVGVMRTGVGLLDRATYPLIEARRAEQDLEGRADILSMLLAASTQDGERLSDAEVRDELLTLVLAGFETTANSLAWTWERLLRTPDAHDALRAAVRAAGENADATAAARAQAVVEATIIEGMRCRPVVPIVGRRVAVPWQLGEYVVPADSAVSVSILLLHHREDLYPDPFEFRPQRWLEGDPPRCGKPGTYEWIPFGGGTRRCLGATLAMAEQRVVLAAMARRLNLEPDRPEPEHAQHRNVTMIPARGAQAILRARA